MGKSKSAPNHFVLTSTSQPKLLPLPSFSLALGKDNDSFEEFMHLEKIREARKEIESMMKIYGRPGLYQDWVNYQREERVRKKQEAEHRAKARAFFINLAQWFVTGLVVFGSSFGLLYWAWLTRGW